MDPQAAWEWIKAEIRDVDQGNTPDRDAMVEALRSLADWIEDEGFYPRP